VTREMLSPHQIAVEAMTLGRAGVGWPTVQRLAVVARHGGIPSLLDLGGSIVEGPQDGIDAVRAVLRRVASAADPAEALERIAGLLRQVSFEVPA